MIILYLEISLVSSSMGSLPEIQKSFFIKLPRLSNGRINNCLFVQSTSNISSLVLYALKKYLNRSQLRHDFFTDLLGISFEVDLPEHLAHQEMDGFFLSLADARNHAGVLHEHLPYHRIYIYGFSPAQRIQLHGRLVKQLLDQLLGFSFGYFLIINGLQQLQEPFLRRALLNLIVVPVRAFQEVAD